MRFSDINRIATDTANYCFANLNQKELIRDSIIKMVVCACIEYKDNSEFKNDIDNYFKGIHYLSKLR